MYVLLGGLLFSAADIGIRCPDASCEGAHHHPRSLQLPIVLKPRALCPVTPLSLAPSMSVLLLHWSWPVSPVTLGLLLCRALVLTSLSVYANLPTQCVGSASLLQGCHCLRQLGLRAPHLIYSPVVFYHSYPLNVPHKT